ncbi:MAG: YbhB/YbcL family Raf kinase inhibitor-like protein, partial [Sphingomonadales bacterium]
MIRSWRAIILLTAAGIAACGTATDRKEANMRISSAAFEDGGAIPSRYSCDGQGISPPLTWSGAPQATRSFALIVDDPDAPGGLFRHWAIFDIPGTAAELQEDAGTRPPAGARQARNDFGKSGYGGPCPPRGHGPHRYRFRLL